MQRLLLLLAFITIGPSLAFAHEIRLSSTYTDIKNQNKPSFLHGISSQIEVNERSQLLLEASYLERFGFFEKKFGAGLLYQLSSSWAMEGMFHHSFDNPEVMIEDQINFNNYFSLIEGYSAFVLLQSSKYSATKLLLMRTGLEIEKFRDLIIIPSLSFGEARFDSPNKSHNLYNIGLKVLYYQEMQYSVGAYFYKGNEAAQIITGILNRTIDTSNMGIIVGYQISPELKTELNLDYLDLDQLDNQFVSTTVNLAWSF